MQISHPTPTITDLESSKAIITPEGNVWFCYIEYDIKIRPQDKRSPQLILTCIFIFKDGHMCAEMTQCEKLKYKTEKYICNPVLLEEHTASIA